MHKGPHISIPAEQLVPRVLGIALDEFGSWPEAVRELATRLAGELFLVRYNPFVDAEMVRASVGQTLAKERTALSSQYHTLLKNRIAAYWRSYDDDTAFRAELVRRLEPILEPVSIGDDPKTLIESATDATDLRMELPLLVLSPRTTPEVQAIVRLAGEMGFAIIPRGGGTGLTGGAVPGSARAVILSLARMKTIISADPETMTICTQAGVITLNAIKAADERDMLFTVDPASKAGSSIGGNISENSGGPFAFEYGTTLDNILSFKQVMPDGRLIEIRRKDHPRHKIMPGETAVFEMVDESGAVTETIALPGDQIRGTGLGKDVSNKFLGGLPGVQKEGVDGIITEGCFICHPKLSHSRVLCLEFFGRSMHNAMLVIKDVVALRDQIRKEGDLVKISALEEFGSKYVQAIQYAKKSAQYEGDPISVLILQLDSDHPEALDRAADAIVDMAKAYENVDILAARDHREGELFWEDRHKLSAISKRTSGFKINEDIVIPMEVIPDFSDFLEELNLFFTARAYRRALRQTAELSGLSLDDESVSQEMDYAVSVLRGQVTAKEVTDQELEVRVAYFLRDLMGRYPKLADELEAIQEHFKATRIVVANHMHAGDGNCHVNIPVNSNDPAMLAEAHEAASSVFERVLELGGTVSGEHGIGITKIAFLQDDKIEALRAYKEKIDPRGIINPGKLTSRVMPVEPYTFSFNRLILDLDKTALPDKERLIRLLANIQVCTRCGKCKQVCPMYFPEQGLLFHPRNKNLALGALIEAIYYSQLHRGSPEPRLLEQLRRITEHCTGCGKCTTTCPVKINTAEVTLDMRAFLEEKRRGGHPVKSRILSFLAEDPERRLPTTAKFLSLGQRIQNKALGLVPEPWRKRMDNPVFSGKGPETEFRNLAETLRLTKGSIFAPESLEDGRDTPEAVFYFPGCGAGLFSRSIGLASLSLLLHSGVSVILPPKHLCCGYPLLAHGMEEAYLANQDRNLPILRQTLNGAKQLGFRATTVLTSCGTCREALQKYGVELIFGLNVRHLDVVQFLLQRLRPEFIGAPSPLIYHAACHAEWTELPSSKAAEAYRRELEAFTGAPVSLSPGCCGESGLGALTSPAIYNKLRGRKQEQLERDFDKAAQDTPVVVGCPSCKIGVRRCLLAMDRRREVMHTVEYLARLVSGPDWKRDLVARLDAAGDPGKGASVRVVHGLGDTVA